MSTLLVLVALACGCRPNTEISDRPLPMPIESELTFDGHDYRIVDAEIHATIGDPYWCDTYNKGQGKAISWSIGFETESDDDELSPPNVDFDILPIRVKNWNELVGYKAKWSDPINPETEERYGLVYVYDHQLISNGSVEITMRDGTSFQVVGSGQNEEGQKFSINAAAEFKGIYVQGSENDTNETVRARLRQYIDDANLEGTPFELNHSYNSGVRMGRSFYSPKTD